MHPDNLMEVEEAMTERKEDPWAFRSDNMLCACCMWYVNKKSIQPTSGVVRIIGRCRRHAPTMSGYPVVYGDDWCGDHKLDENKL